MNELAVMSWEGHPQFAELSDKGRATVRARIAAVEHILKAKPRGHAVAHAAKELGICGSAMRRLVTLYVRSGGRWQSLIDRRAETHKDQKLPEAFIDFWKSLCEDNQRKNKPAWRELRRLYWSKATTYVTPKGQVVDLWPGYAERPAKSPSSKDDLPRGWSYANLSLFAPTRLELANARIGPIAAGELLEDVLTTRRGLKPGQHYIPDDCWIDLKVTLSASISRHAVRPVELSCLDIASAKKIAWGLTPMVTDDEGKRSYIKKRDMRYLLAKILCVVGFHHDGVTFWVEHGSAGIWPEMEELIVALAASFGFSITVKRSGIKGGKCFGGGFETLGRGNSRFKAALESNHNLCHNERANLPGQVGNNSRINAVEDIHGRDREAIEILTAALQYRPAVREALRTGYLTFGEYFWAHAAVERQIACYHDHELEGWEDNEMAIFRVTQDSPWQPVTKLLSMTPVQRAAMDALFEAEPDLMRTRRMSREEVWQRGQDELVRLPMHCVPAILGPELAKVRTVADDGTFGFEDEDCGQGKLHFNGRECTRPDGSPEPLVPRKSYRTWVNPFDPSVLFVATTEGNYLGTCPAKTVLNRDDEDGFQREVVAVRTRHAETLAPALARQRNRNRVITANRKANLALMNGAPATEAERRAEETRQAEELSAEDRAAFAPDVPPPAPASAPNSDLTTKDFL